MTHKNTRQSGFSLIELMVAITIGLIVSGAVASIFVQSRESYSQNDEINYIQDNGRYALNLLANDLEVAGLFGGMSSPATITYETDPTVDNYLLAGIECGKASKFINGVPSWTYDATMAISYSKSPSSSVVALDYPCVPSFQAGSDFLTVKRVRGDPVTAALSPDTVYLYTDRSSGVFHTSKVALPSNMTAWEYFVNLYYIDNNTLKKVYLTYDSNTKAYIMKETDVAQGIEKFHVVFGIDTTTDLDSIPEYYTSTPSATELAAAVTARVYVLARGSKQMTGYTNAKTYQLGDVTVDYSTTGKSDGYYRRVFSTAVGLRNLAMVSKFSD